MRRCGIVLRYAGVVCGLLATMAVSAAPATVKMPAYPAPGVAAPAAPCARPGPSPALDFFCRFLTQELWQRAGRPDYVEGGGKRWQVWFYGRDGDTNQLLVEGREYLPGREGWFEALFDVGNFDAQTYDYFWDLFRYAPWSVQFLTAGGCGGGQLLNPAALAGERFRRRHVLGLGWPGLAEDADDPARTFGAAALPQLLAVTHLQYALEPALQPLPGDGAALRIEVAALAEGHGRLWPDFDKDGGVWLIERDGTTTALPDLDEAAARFAAHGLLMTNDAMRSWESGRQAAADLARERGPLLFMYFAGDPFLPIDRAGPYEARLRYLLAGAVRAAGKPAALHVITRGRSAGIVADVLARYPGVGHETAAPVISPLDPPAYAEALRQAAGAGRLDVAVPGLPALSGADTAADCL